MVKRLLFLILGCVAIASRAEGLLCEDERAGLRFLDFVTAPMSAADETEWWEIGGGQFGLFAKRYNIAFAGYAAAELGMRGTDEERRKVGRILDNCIRRMLARDVWAYSQSKKYWGEKPWAPDPCFRENVMYTGHLLQLLALYETFTRDTKYWTQGFDFVWSKEKRVHYDVQKLIDVTVDQMRTNDFCGVTCEPGLLFFPCNNHPQVAFKLFKRLGHGDWSADSRRWEKWALGHFLSPFFGGGAINLLYHVKSGMFYPRGSSGLDGWSLLWYEPWAEKRETSLALWKTAAAKIDWDDMDAASDERREEGGCCDPLAVPHSVTAAFLAAAARANDDPATAERLEKAVDVHLVRTNGLYYLNLNREWRIGATAHRIISLAKANANRQCPGTAAPSLALDAAETNIVEDSIVRKKFAVADRAATGDVTVVNVPWRFKDGRIDWLFNPTKGRKFNPEWTWQLNRMYFWRDFVRAYEATKDERYVRAFVRQLEDWLNQTGGVPPEKGYNDCGSAWRTIEEGLRLMGSWHEAWHAFRSSPVFTHDLQERFKASALAQARHLLRHRTPEGNWLLMEMNGVYAFATDFPELEDSARMRKEASDCLSAAIRRQILPDGMQYELSPDYHSVAVTCARQMYETAVRSGFAGELPADFAPLLERMADAVLSLATPSFVQPRFNDCFTIRGDQMVGRLAPLFPARRDLAWLASRRASGEPPAGATASRYLPWAGFAAMRSDWGPDATYLAFDVGPLGMAHAHQDKLSFTLWKGGEELVFDDGGGQYDISSERVYAISGHDHNTLLVDGLAQKRSEPRVVTEPIDAGWKTTPEFDRAFGVYDQGFGPDERRLVRHRREIFFDKAADVVVVTDDVRSVDGREHDYAILFQLDTTNTVVSADGKSLTAYYGRVWNLSLEVAEGGRIETAVGRPAPDLAGWYVGRNDQSNHVATTVFVRAPKGRDRRLVTMLRPVKD